MSLRLFITEPLTVRFASPSMEDEFGVKKIAPSKRGGWRRLEIDSIVKEVVEANKQ